MSSGSQGSVLEQTVTLAPITALSCWAFLLPLNDFLSGLTRAYNTDRHRWTRKLFSPKTYCRFPESRSIWTLHFNHSLSDMVCFWRCNTKAAWPLAPISINRIPVLPHTFSRTVCGDSLSELVSSLQRVQLVAAGLYWKQPLQPTSVPGRHSATLPTADTSNQSSPQARHVCMQGMTQSGACVVKSPPPHLKEKAHGER